MTTWAENASAKAEATMQEAERKVEAIRNALDAVKADLDRVALEMRAAALDPVAFSPLADRRANLASRQAVLRDALAEAEVEHDKARTDWTQKVVIALHERSLSLAERIASTEDEYREHAAEVIRGLCRDCEPLRALIAERVALDKRTAELAGRAEGFFYPPHPSDLPAAYVAAIARSLIFS